MEILRHRIEELEQQGSAHDGISAVQDLAAENQVLEAEVANLYTLQEENKMLRGRLEKCEEIRREVASGPDSGSRVDQITGLMGRSGKGLKVENQRLQCEVEQLTAENRRLHQACRQETDCEGSPGLRCTSSVPSTLPSTGSIDLHGTVGGGGHVDMASVLAELEADGDLDDEVGMAILIRFSFLF